MFNFLGRLFLALAILTWGYSHLLLDHSNKTPSKAFISNLLTTNGVTFDQALFNQAYTYLIYAVMAAPLMIIFRCYGCLVAIFYIILNVQRYASVVTMPYTNAQEIFSILNFLSVDFGIVGGLLLAGCGACKKSASCKK